MSDEATPDSAPWRPTTIAVEELVDVTLLADDLKFPEGPVAMRDGSVLVTEIDGGRIVRVDADGGVDIVAECRGGPNGAAIGPDGALYVCNNGGRFADGNYDGGWVERVDLDTGQVEVLMTECDDRRLSGPNDIVFDESGGFWFTDTGKFRGRERDVGSVYYVPSGSDRPTEVVHPAETPNGVGLSGDGATLYYAETTTARLRRRSITGGGSLEPAEPHDPDSLVCGLPGDQLFDSLALDTDGNVCIGTLLAGCITVVPTDGHAVIQRMLPAKFADRLPTNICFGGADGATAYVTLAETGRLVSCTWPVPGAPLAFDA